MPDITLKAVLEATKLKRKKGIGQPVTESFGNFNISEPSNFAPDGRSYYSNPKDWKEKHEYAKDKLTSAGFHMHGCSPWNSTWSLDGATKVKLDYWEDYDAVCNTVNSMVKNPPKEAVVESLENDIADHIIYDADTRFVRSDGKTDVFDIMGYIAGKSAGEITELVDDVLERDDIRRKSVDPEYLCCYNDIVDPKLQITGSGITLTGSVYYSDADGYSSEYNVDITLPIVNFPQALQTEEGKSSENNTVTVGQVVEQLNEYLADNRHRDRVHETTDGRIICEIDLGDWKHEHFWFKQLVKNFMEDRGYMYKMAYTKGGDEIDDCYSATYYITVQDAVVESQKVESYEPLVKRVSIAFDAQIPADYTEENLEKAIKLALETKAILVDSYMEIHTNE